jgi:feruloyl-CoA synthase
MLVFPDEEVVRLMAPHLPPATPFGKVIVDPDVKNVFRARLAEIAQTAAGSSSRITRIALLAEPPSIDLGESTDKGSLNQRALLVNRASDVEALYADDEQPHIIKL